MFILKDDHFGYSDSNGQCTTRGRFLLLLQPNIYKHGGALGETFQGPTRWLDIQASCAAEKERKVS